MRVFFAKKHLARQFNSHEVVSINASIHHLPLFVMLFGIQSKRLDKLKAHSPGARSAGKEEMTIVLTAIDPTPRSTQWPENTSTILLAGG